MLSTAFSFMCDIADAVMSHVRNDTSFVLRQCFSCLRWESFTSFPGDSHLVPCDWQNDLLVLGLVPNAKCFSSCHISALIIIPYWGGSGERDVILCDGSFGADIASHIRICCIGVANCIGHPNLHIGVALARAVCSSVSVCNFALRCNSSVYVQYSASKCYPFTQYYIFYRPSIHRNIWLI